MRFTITTLLLLVASLTFSQTGTQHSELSQEQSSLKDQEILTVRINLRNVSKNAQGEIKDEYEAMAHRFVQIELDEYNEELTLVHNRFVKKEEVVDVLWKYGLDESCIVFYH